VAEGRNGTAVNRFDREAACATLSKWAPVRPEIPSGTGSWRMPACAWALAAAPVLTIRARRAVDSRTLVGGRCCAADGRLRSRRMSSAGVIPPILDGAPESP
jgi:hypothetical protein